MQGDQGLDVKQDAITGALISEMQGSEGVAVKQEATGELVSVMQGSERIDIKQKATTGEMIAELVGSEGNPILQSATTDALIAVMVGDEAIPIAQEAATGEMIAIFKALYNSSLITVAADANGRLSADFGLYEQATFDMDTYADGTDSRISYSSLVSMDLVKYWINNQNSLIAVRHIDVQGSAALGIYSLTLASEDVISGSTGVNSTITDTKVYRKTIADSVFDYSESNCSFKGLIIDYLFNPNDISSTYSIITGGASATNTFDDNLTTFAGEYTTTSESFITVWEVSFSSISIKASHIYLQMKYSAINYSYYQLQIYDGSWQTVSSGSAYGTSYNDLFGHDISNYTGVTKTRLQIRAHSAGNTAYAKIYDISIMS